MKKNRFIFVFCIMNTTDVVLKKACLWFWTGPHFVEQLGWEVTDECNVMLKCKVRGKENTKCSIPRNTLINICLDG